MIPAGRQSRTELFGDSHKLRVLNSAVRMENLLIVKVGGGAGINLEGLASDLAACEHPMIVVLGANATRNRLAQRLGTPPEVITSVSGYDSVLTDSAAIDLIMMTYAGLARGRMVEMLQSRGVNAIGLSGIDGRLIEGERNRGIRVRENGRKRIVRDLSGKPRRVNKTLIRQLLESGYVPVVGIPVIDESGVAINADNDNIVAALHRALNAERVVHFIEAAGVLANPDDPGSAIPTLDICGLQEREAASSGRIKRKLLAIRQLLETAPTQVIVSDGRTAHPYQDVLAGAGTRIGRETR